ncbi:MAG: hypothetical protein IPK71_35185 [Myxococcales bacterium]|nr:hypothetical protein [Myxococcales bacterium]
MKLFKLALVVSVAGSAVACASSAPAENSNISEEMEQAIDAFVKTQADPVVPEGTSLPTTGTPKSSKSSGVGGIDPVGLGKALKLGATSVPSGGAASGPSNAGGGGTGASGLVGGTGGSTNAGNGGVSAGPAGFGGGSTSFAEAACYMIGNVCRYIGRCFPRLSGDLGEVCAVPATCPQVVARALAEANVTVPPQAAPVLRCFGDAVSSAPCFGDDDEIAKGLSSSFLRCGGAAPEERSSQASATGAGN